MEKINLRKHKKFLNLLKLVLTRYYNFFFLHSNVLGVFFDIRGKLGVTGSAKKRHMKLSTGTYSSTTKKNKISFDQTIVRTSTGVLGVTFCIFF
jgi:ribosomal protein S3